MCSHKYHLPYQVGVGATGVQSWAKEHCKHSDGQGTARMPQFRWAGSHFYLKHGCFAQLIKTHLFPRCPFWPGLKILHFGEVPVIPVQMLRVFMNNPSCFVLSHTKDVTGWRLFHFAAVSSVFLGLWSQVSWESIFGHGWLVSEAATSLPGFKTEEGLLSVCS